VISFKNVTKIYGKGLRVPGLSGVRSNRDGEPERYALKDVSFSCRKGEALALLGPNGAGKTTALRILSSSLKPTSGEVRYGDVDIVKDPTTARGRIGMLACNTPLYHRLSVRENLEFWGRLHGVSGAPLGRRVAELVERFALQEFIEARGDALSTGQRQRAAFARAVIHSPAVFILDEPTTGLDVLASAELLEFIAGLKRAGVAIVFSTHHFHEVEKVCDQVVVMLEGQVQFQGALDEFRTRDADGGLHGAFMSFMRTRMRGKYVGDLCEGTP
jgi:sodium transport system ATP-binding protein